MASVLRLLVDFTNLSASDTESKLAVDSDSPLISTRRVADLLRRVASSCHSATVRVGTSMARATGTVTFTDAVTNGQTCSIANVTVTGATSGNGTTSFTLSATIATQAANLAALINANTTINKVLSATSAAGVVTVTSLVPGLVGDAIGFRNVNLSNTTFAGPTGGAETLTSLGLV